jgi:hypothetical protein
MNDQDLERLVDKRLKALPPRRAPGTLLPAVMQQVRARALRPWYARPWTTWPAEWQVASIAALVLVVAAFAMSAPALQPLLARPMALAAALLAPANELVAAVSTLTTMVEIVTRVIGQSIVGVVLALFVVMFTTTVAIGAAIGRVAVGRA